MNENSTTGLDHWLGFPLYNSHCIIIACMRGFPFPEMAQLLCPDSCHRAVKHSPPAIMPVPVPTNPIQ